MYQQEKVVFYKSCISANKKLYFTLELTLGGIALMQI